MGRQLRRVPLDFSWPLDTRYEGFLNPHYDKASKCEHCGGSGCSPEGKLLQDRWYGHVEFRPEDRGSVPFQPTHPIIRLRAERNVPLEGSRFYGYDPAYIRREAAEIFRTNGFADESIRAEFDKIVEAEIVKVREGAIQREARRLADLFNAQWSHHLNQDDVNVLVAAGRLMDFTHEWVDGTGWVKKVPEVIPTAVEVNEWSLSGMGHDSINQWKVCGAEAKRLGIETTCSHCEGEGRVWPSEEARLACENWTKTEPPTGEGYQMWETVSEGSPISPVFATPHELALHMSKTRWGADTGTSYEAWMNMICGDGWAPSMLGSSQKGLMNGVQGLYVMDNPEEPDQ